MRSMIAGCLLGSLFTLSALQAQAQQVPSPAEMLAEFSRQFQQSQGQGGPIAVGTSANENTRVRIRVDWPVEFDHASKALDLTGLAWLKSAAFALNSREFAAFMVSVTGHTDVSGSASANDRLSEERAKVVKNTLVRIFEVQERRIRVAGAGSRQLKILSDPMNRANRRVEIRLLNETFDGATNLR